MTDKQPEALRVADELLEPIEGFPSPTTLEKNAAALLRTQHAAIERKDALLKRAFQVILLYVEIDREVNELYAAIEQELAK